MERVLYVGQKPETVDFSDPALPQGMSADKIKVGIAVALKGLRDRGWAADECMITPDNDGCRALEQKLVDTNYDCVVIGAGLRLPEKTLALFELVINIIHEHAQDAFIVFNTAPEDTADAAARWIGD